MVTASGERIVGKAISADSPAFFHVAHAEVNPELGRRLKRSKGPPFVPGKDRIEAARRAAVSTHASLRDPPSGVAHAHGVALRGDGSAFRRRVGAAESYVEQAAESSDLLVWQRTQDRDEDFSSPLQTLRPVSRVDYYAARRRSATTSASSAARRASRRRRRSAAGTAAARARGPPWAAAAAAAATAPRRAARGAPRARPRPRARRGGRGRGREPALAAGTPPFHRTWVSSPRAPLVAPEASTAADDVAAFERRNHAALELGDYSKRELVALIAAQGLDPPGRLVWDPASATMVRESLPKETYVDFCRQKFYERDPRPLVRVGRRLRAAPGGGLAVRDASAELPGDGGGDGGALYRVVSVYRADDGGARVVCYDPRTCAYGRLLLLKERLEELHVGPAPARDADYPPGAAASGHRERGRRRVGRAARRAPGDTAPPRPDAAAAASPVVLRHPPSRHMVTQWFDFM
ncbi:hypothetical protein JL722_5376 [Aureococcus anophagefferens]|nr:hypothetical protein JL722_5376 [Aureococcus anophagefferens]